MEHMEIESLPEPLRKLVQEELAVGERVRWVDQPIPRTGFPWVALAPMFIAIPWTAFAVYWTATAAGLLDRGRPDQGPVATVRYIFALFGVPFILLGLVMLTSPIWMVRRARRAAERTAYVITDRRAIVFDGGFAGDYPGVGILMGMLRPPSKGTNIRSYPPEKITEVQRTQRDDGSGDLLFHQVVVHDETGEAIPIVREGFFAVRNVKEVEGLLQALARTAKVP
jgi:hypothetical protein